MLASGENDPSDDHQTTITLDGVSTTTPSTPSARPSSTTPSPAQTSTSQQPFWANAQVPEVVPYAEPEEEEEEPEKEDNRAPAPPLPSNFFAKDAPKQQESFVPSRPAPSLDSTDSQQPPVDPRPGSTPGRPNPFGFPNGYSANHGGGGAPAASTGAPSSAVPQVRLSSAVALAQSLPTGTAMGFSMDYVFLSEFLPNARYAWIIQPPRGKAIAMEVRLQQQGSLSQFVTQWGPMEGTYQLQLVIMDSQGKPRPMSRAIDAFYAY